MKFAQLAIGQRFTSQGEAYTKISPLMAEPLAGGTGRLISRSAPVTPLDAPPREREPPTEVAVEDLDRAMAQLADEINGILTASGLDSARIARLSHELQQAFGRARKNLKLNG